MVFNNEAEDLRESLGLKERITQCFPVSIHVCSLINVSSIIISV